MSEKSDRPDCGSNTARPAPGNELLALRNAIDGLDLELVGLLNKRAVLSLQIGELKKKSGAPIYQPNRESQKLAELRAANSGPLNADQISEIYERIFEISRALQK